MKMLTRCLILLLLPLMVAELWADVPKNLNPAHFSKHIANSPFTIKPPTGVLVPVDTPLERDWMLGSIRPSADGYSVTLINKKDRKDRVRFLPGVSSGEFKLLEVKQDVNNNMNSRVRVRRGNLTAWLTYDEKLIKVKPAVVAKKAPVRSSSRSSSRNSNARPPMPGSNNRSSSGRTRQRSVPRTNR